ncbi:MAG: hypothetical protein RI861_09815, partial [Planktomarina sp.]|nr:hypothetical protein [Planktomarina sp.]
MAAAQLLPETLEMYLVPANRPSLWSALSCPIVAAMERVPPPEKHMPQLVVLLNSSGVLSGKTKSLCSLGVISAFI